MDSADQEASEKTFPQPAYRKHGLVIVILLVALFGGMLGYLIGSRTASQQSTTSITLSSTPSSRLTPVVSSSVTPFPTKSLHTTFLTGTYPSTWNYTSIPVKAPPPVNNNPFDTTVCPTLNEEDMFMRPAVDTLIIYICIVNSNSPETLLETIDAHKFPQDYSYTPNSAAKASRLGLEGLKGTWLKGVTGLNYPTPTYEPEHFEIYVKNNHMILLEYHNSQTEIDTLLQNIHANL